MASKTSVQPSLFTTPKEGSLRDAAPVLKWAGGKGQLLPILRRRLPAPFFSQASARYIEPFVGGGALFFDLMSRDMDIEAFIIDINPELIILYRVLQREVEGLIELLAGLETNYLNRDPEARKAMYYQQRDVYNADKPQCDPEHYQPSWIKRAALTIFLNKTCFNGLFRVNKKGLYNVPMGNYQRPTILHEKRLRAAATALQRAAIHFGDFTIASSFIHKHSFVYYDPPYRPISNTAYFKDYAGKFDDDDQRRLANFYTAMHERGAYQLLSNSDPSNTNPHDRFFDDLYAPYTIERIEATRMINSKASQRGAIRELLIRNFR